MKNYYDILGVATHADQRVIKAAFKVLAQAHHPDRLPEEQRAEANARMQEINEAFTVLSDPSRRRRYDEQLQGRQESESPPARSTASAQGSSFGTLKKALVILGSLVLSLIFAVHEKSMFQRGWDFLSSGFSDSSAYAINWPLFLLIMGAGVWFSGRVGR